MVEENGEAETAEELVEEETEIVDETNEEESTDELVEESVEVVEEDGESEIIENFVDAEVEVDVAVDDKYDPLTSEELGYHEGEIPLVDENLSDLEKVASALDYAQVQKEAYLQRVSDGELIEDEEIISALDDAISYAQEKYDDVSNGQPYSDGKVSDFFRTNEGQNMVGIGAKVVSKAIQYTSGYSDPTGNVDSVVSDFTKFTTPYVVDVGEQMMQNARDMYETPEAQMLNRDYFMRDANGNPITAKQGQELAFAETTSFPNETGKVKDEIANDVVTDNNGKKVLAGIGIGLAVTGAGITYSMPDVKAYDPLVPQTEIVRTIDQKEQIDSLMKFHGESALNISEGIAKLLEDDDSSMRQNQWAGIQLENVSVGGSEPPKQPCDFEFVDGEDGFPREVIIHVNDTQMLNGVETSKNKSLGVQGDVAKIVSDPTQEKANKFVVDDYHEYTPNSYITDFQETSSANAMESGFDKSGKILSADINGQAAYIPQDAPPLTKSNSDEYRSIVETLESSELDYRPIRKAEQNRTSQEIIEDLGGGDLTKGSCSSLAFAYVGNKAGYNVLDFRGGDSRVFFSQNDSIELVANLPGVESETIYGKDDIHCANQLMQNMEVGKEYYLATGLHASIVRKSEDGYEFLELQSAKNNGWQTLDDDILKNRFGCETENESENPNFLIEVSSLGKSTEFCNILGFINTAEEDQMKGESGHVR